MPALSAITTAPSADPGLASDGQLALGATPFAADLAQAGDDLPVLPLADAAGPSLPSDAPALPDLAALLSAILTPHQASTQQVEAFLSAGGDPALAAEMLASMALPSASGQPGADLTAAPALAVVPTLAALSTAEVTLAIPSIATSVTQPTGPASSLAISATRAGLVNAMPTAATASLPSDLAQPQVLAWSAAPAPRASIPSLPTTVLPTAPVPAALPASPSAAAMVPPVAQRLHDAAAGSAVSSTSTSPLLPTSSPIGGQGTAVASADPVLPADLVTPLFDKIASPPMPGAVAPTADAPPSQAASLSAVASVTVQPKRTATARTLATVEVPAAPAATPVQDPVMVAGLGPVIPVATLPPDAAQQPAESSAPPLATATPEQAVSSGPVPTADILPTHGLATQTQGELAKMHGGEAQVGATTRDIPSMTATAATTTATTMPVSAAPLAGSRSSATAEGNPLERAVARQVSQALVRTQANGDKLMVLRLTPPELGTVRIELTERDGTLSARLHADDQGVRQALERLLPQIRHDLRGQDATIRSVELGDGRPDRQNNDGQPSHQQRRDDPGWNQAQDRPRRDGPAFSLDGSAPNAPVASPTRAPRSLGGTITASTVDATA